MPEEFMPRWLIRGPHGQVRLDVDANGHVTDFYGYSSWGNRIHHENSESPYKPPPYLDGDYAPVPGFEQFKVGAGTAQDMTQMFGALDVVKESGAAGDGASGNPDVGPGSNSTFLQDGNRSGFYAGGEWHDTELKLLPAYPSELHLPGTGTDKAPPSAPKTAEDMATQADKRLRDTWGAQRFWGPKPGQQTGSRQLDDYRDMFQPLPAYPPIGGISGPAGFGSWRWVPPGPIPPPPVPLPASPPAGPWPVLPNEDSGGDGDTGGSGDGGNGNTGGDYDSYHNAMERATGGDFATPPPGDKSHTGPDDVGSSDTGGDDSDWKSDNNYRNDNLDPMQDAMDAQDAPWYEMLDDFADAINWVHDHTIGAAAGAVTSLPGVNYLAQKSAAAAKWAQDRVDDAGESVCGEQRWSNFRDVVNYENKYISAIDNAADFAAIGAYGAGLVKGGLKGIAKAGLKASLSRDIGRSASQMAEYTVYYGIREGKRAYVGITTNLPQRTYQHRHRFGELDPISKVQLPKDKALAIEQVIKLKNPGFENIRNPISPRREWYDDATKWGRDWLDLYE